MNPDIYVALSQAQKDLLEVIVELGGTEEGWEMSSKLQAVWKLLEDLKGDPEENV